MQYLEYKRELYLNGCILREPSASYDYGQKKIDKYHDKTFKELFTNKKEAVEFINKYLGIKGTESELKKEHIEKCNTEFLTKNKEKLESDILYRIKGTQICILIEHQSRMDYTMPQRVLEYCIEIMREAEKEGVIDYKEANLPTVYPIVLYTGQEKWKAATELTQLQKKILGVKDMITACYTLVDIHDYSKEELIQERSSIAKAMLNGKD